MDVWSALKLEPIPMTVDDLKREFSVYFDGMDQAVKSKCYWPLLHMLLVMPDICSSLETPTEHSGDRYIRWCRENMPPNPKVEPGDRCQMRNAVLHTGTTLADNSHTKSPVKQTQYRLFSFVDPDNFSGGDVHQTVDAAGDILTIDIARLEQDTRAAILKWFSDLQHDPARLAAVKQNLPTLARIKPKVAHLIYPSKEAGRVLIVEYRGMTTSST
jgi:hypothetical protein